MRSLKRAFLAGLASLFLDSCATFGSRPGECVEAEDLEGRIVSIASADVEFAGDEVYVKGFGHGSGFVFDGRYIATAAHVVEGKNPKELSVVSLGGERYYAEGVLLDREHDIALLRYRGEAGTLEYAALPLAKLREGLQVFYARPRFQNEEQLVDSMREVMGGSPGLVSLGFEDYGAGGVLYHGVVQGSEREIRVSSRTSSAASSKPVYRTSLFVMSGDSGTPVFTGEGCVSLAGIIVAMRPILHLEMHSPALKPQVVGAGPADVVSAGRINALLEEQAQKR